MANAPKASARPRTAGALQAGNLPVLLTVAAMVVGLAALLPLVQSSDATTTAGNIQLLEQQQTDWQARLRELELQVASLGSLDRIQAEAVQRLKMVPPQEIHYIAVPAPAPQQSKLPNRYLPPAQPSQHSGSSLWSDLFGWVPLP